MKARFASQCPECGRRIEQGSEIRRSNLLARKFVHSACVDGDPEYDAEAAAEARYFSRLPGGDMHGEVRGWNDDDREYARGVNDTRVAQMAGPAGSAAREQAYMDMEAQWAREGFDG